jgi:hypothetical protein
VLAAELVDRRQRLHFERGDTGDPRGSRRRDTRDLRASGRRLDGGGGEGGSDREDGEQAVGTAAVG